MATEAAILNPQHPQYMETLRLIARWPGVDRSAVYEGKTAAQMAREAKRADLSAILEEKPR